MSQLTATQWFGDARYDSKGLNEDVPLNGLQPGGVRCYTILPTNSGVTVTLPDAREYPKGCPIFIVRNESGTRTVTIRYNDQTMLGTLITNTTGMFCLEDNSTQNGVWSVITHTNDTARTVY